jgi:hypothetical protein
MLRKLMLVPILGAIALLLIVGSASAAPKVPKGEPLFDEPVTLPAGQLCDFAVTLQGISGQAVRTTLPGGTTILTGPAVITITNETNELSTTLNISGPTFTSGDDAILTGPAIILLFPGVPSNPAGPGILATTGRATLVDGVFDIDTFTGRTQDVCEQLAE